MGIKSTETLTRDECIERILSLMEEKKLGLYNLSNIELEDMLEELQDDIFTNFLIKE